jgi:uncharacterized protein YdhG (YjbR/CyaY superfamily)
MAAKPTTFDEYLANVGDDQRGALEELRQTIRAAAPEARECISYGLAAFREPNGVLVALGASPKHCAFYLMSNSTVAAHEEDLKGYDTSTGTVRFQPGAPLPEALVRKLVHARLVENERLAAEKGRGTAARGK